MAGHLTERDQLFNIRCEFNDSAHRLMVRKNMDYAHEAFPIANYQMAAAVAGCSPAQYIAGRMAEKCLRLGNVLKRGTDGGESAEDELLDLQNFPGLILYAMGLDDTDDTIDE